MTAENKPLYRYSAYELSVLSEFEIPELPSVESHESATDVVVEQGTVEPVPESVDDFGGRRVVADAEECRLTYESIGSFLVKRGEQIVCDPLTPEVPDREFFRRLIANELLGLILYQRGYLVLHASAVRIGDHAVLFLGRQGAGKSTTAAAFDAQGYPILEDDVVAIRFDGDIPIVVPGVPQIRLRPDAAEALGVTDVTQPSTESWYDKRFLDVEEIPEAAPLAGCYIIQDGDEFDLGTLSGPDQLMELIRATYARGLLSDTGASPIHLQQCSTVIEQTRCRLLSRPKDHAQLPSLVDFVVEDVNSNVSTDP